MVNTFTQLNFTNVLHEGIMSGIRKDLKKRIMDQVEKDIDEVINNVVKDMEGYVSREDDYATQRVMFNVEIKRK